MFEIQISIANTFQPLYSNPGANLHVQQQQLARCPAPILRFAFDTDARQTRVLPKNSWSYTGTAPVRRCSVVLYCTESVESLSAFETNQNPVCNFGMAPNPILARSQSYGTKVDVAIPSTKIESTLRLRLDTENQGQAVRGSDALLPKKSASKQRPCRVVHEA